MLCCKFSLLVRQVWSYQVDLNIRLQTLLRLGHLQVVSGDNWREYTIRLGDILNFLRTFDVDFMLPRARVCVEVDLDRNLAHAPLGRRG